MTQFATYKTIAEITGFSLSYSKQMLTLIKQVVKKKRVTKGDVIRYFDIEIENSQGKV
jgi:hypothetical protein